MKKYLIFWLLVVALITGALIFLFFFAEKEKPPNEQVMHGLSSYEEYVQKRPDWLKEADDEFINTVMNSGEVKNRYDAAQELCNTGSEYFNEGNRKTAIKRFNQAWLLDHNHPCVYALYGSYSALEEKDFEKSFEMFEKALSLSTEKNSSWILRDYAEALAFCYASDKTRVDCLDKALANATKSLSISDEPKGHRVLAIVYYYKEEFEKAWTQIHLAMDAGMSKTILDPWITRLKKQMPDPKGKY